MNYRSLNGLGLVGVAILAACTSGDNTPGRDTAAATPNVASLSTTEYAFQVPHRARHDPAVPGSLKRGRRCAR